MSASSPITEAPQPSSDFEKLQVAAGLVAFDRALGGAAQTVGVYAFIFLVVSAVVLAGGSFPWFALVLGVLLLVETIYLARVRSARALWIAGLTFAAFSIWLIINFAIAWATNDPKVGRGIIAALFLAFGAWSLLKSYRTYKLLLERSDPAINLRVRAMLERLRKAKAADRPEMIEWRVRGMGEKGFWRMVREENLMLLAKFADKTFGLGGPVERALWIEPSNLRVEREGEKWLGKKLNAKLWVAQEEMKISIEPQMFERLESLLMGTLSQPTQTI